ncbi:hypothetical protein FHS70_002088 [Flammeovirga yaeyamensis]|nr:hypothetical protein [Flammeovirga yaeyamensis]
MMMMKKGFRKEAFFYLFKLLLLINLNTATQTQFNRLVKYKFNINQ